MKRRILVLILAMTMVLAVAYGQGTETGNQPVTTGMEIDPRGIGANGTAEPTLLANSENTQNQGEDSQIQVQDQNQVQSQKLEEIKQKVQEKKQEMANQAEAMGTKEQKVYQNQNEVRSAVHALLEMKDVVGGIGPQVSEIAKQFNNSVKATINAEEKIEKRSGVAKFFFGGDKAAAEELEAEAQKNQQKIQELKQLKDQCECSEEVKAMMQEQIQAMEGEQQRLIQKATEEKAKKGLLGWMFK